MKHIETFDWHRIFQTEHIPISYLAEIVFRTVVMFLIVIAALKFLSKRGVKQLSVFELAILIALGSATGDPMFYNEIPITYGLTVIFIVVLLYKIITRFTAKNKRIEILLEGQPICLLTDGKIEYKNYKRIGLPYDKFFAELRLRSIDHLGQVRKAYLETSGEISIYMFDDDNVRPGLPIYPELLSKAVEHIKDVNSYACIYCGNIQESKLKNNKCCVCHNSKWLLPKSNKRIH